MEPFGQLSPEFTFAFLLILVRTSGMLVSAPLLNHRGIPAWTKVGFAITFSLVLVPLQSPSAPPPPQQLGTIVDGVLREALFGLALGLAMNLVFLGLQLASRIVGLQMGFGLGGVLDPMMGGNAEFGTFDQFYAVLVTLVFFTISGHHLVIQALAESVRAVPPGSFDPLSMRAEALPVLMAGLTVTAVRIAMPVMAALFLADLGLGFVARTVPQANVLIVGLPIKIIVGLIVLIAALPATVQLMSGVINGALTGSSQQLLGAR
jgi:flagellar biosynthetic protein FliR